MRIIDLFRPRSAGGPASSGLARLPRGDGPSGLRARLEGAMAKRRLRGWNPPLENINALVAAGGPRLLARARELVVTNGYAANGCEAFAANLVGDGIKPSSLIEDAGLRERVQRLWLAWTDEADADGLTDFYGLQAMVAREMFVAGECFVRLRPRRAEDGLLVPMQLQLLQSEMLPFEKTELLPSGNRIRCGIEFDGIGRRVAYHFRRRHPGDSTDQRVAVPDTVRVPAEDVLHIYRPIDAGQIRGLPHVAPAMVRLFLLDQYDDAELDRKKTAAMFAGSITKTAPEEPMMGEGAADTEGAVIASLEPGTMQVLLIADDGLHLQDNVAHKCRIVTGPVLDHGEECRHPTFPRIHHQELSAIAGMSDPAAVRHKVATVALPRAASDPEGIAVHRAEEIFPIADHGTINPQSAATQQEPEAHKVAGREATSARKGGQPFRAEGDVESPLIAGGIGHALQRVVKRDHSRKDKCQDVRIRGLVICVRPGMARSGAGDCARKILKRGFASLWRRKAKPEGFFFRIARGKGVFVVLGEVVLDRHVEDILDLGPGVSRTDPGQIVGNVPRGIETPLADQPPCDEMEMQLRHGLD